MISSKERVDVSCEITRNGAPFLIVMKLTDTDKEAGKVVATYENGVLKTGVATYAYIQSSDTLLVQGWVGLEFHRLK